MGTKLGVLGRAPYHFYSDPSASGLLSRLCMPLSIPGELPLRCHYAIVRLSIVSGHYRRCTFPHLPYFSPLTSTFASLRTPAVASVPFKRKTRASQILGPTSRCIPVILLITPAPKLAIWGSSTSRQDPYPKLSSSALDAPSSRARTLKPSDSHVRPHPCAQPR